MTTNFIKTALACVVTLFSLIGCEKMGEETSLTQTFIKGEYLITPTTEVEVTVKKRVENDTTYYFIFKDGEEIRRDTIPPVNKEIIKRDTVIVPKYETDTVTFILRDSLYFYTDTILYGKAYPKGNGIYGKQKYVIENSDLVDQKELTAQINVLLNGGKTEVKAEPVVNASTATISNNIASFNISDGANGTGVENNWSLICDTVVEFNDDGYIITEKIEDPIVVKQLAFYQTNITSWELMASLYLSDIPQATATWEFWKEEEVVTPDPVYTFKTVHKEATLNGNSITDTHLAELYKDGEKVESHEYDALWSINHSKNVTLPRETAEAIQNMSIKLNNGSCELGSYEFFATINLTDVKTVEMQENGTTYCHPVFTVNNGVALLSCCNLSCTNVVIGSINGDVLPAEIIIVGDKEIKKPINIKVEENIPDPVWGVEFADEAWPISATLQMTYAYPTKDGVRTGEEVKLYAPIETSLTAGETIYKTSNGTVELVSTEAEVSGNMASFSYALEGNFRDGWQISASTEGVFTYEGHGITKTATIPLKAEKSVKSVSFTKNSGTYSNKATLFLDSFATDSDVQIIIVEKPADVHGVEWEGPFFSTNMREVSVKFFPTVNGERTGAVIEKKMNLEYTFTPGAPLEFNSNDTPSIKDANAVLVGNEAFIPHILGSTEFNANFTYGGTTRVTFSYSDEYVSDEVTVDLNISYDVKAIGAIEQNGTSYSTPAALYANGVEVEKEKFVFKVNGIKPTYPGYRVYNPAQWAITRVYNQNASQSLVVLVGTLEHIETGDIYAIHQVLEGSAGNLPQNFQKVSTPTFGEPYSMRYNVATSSWEYGSIVGAKKGTTNSVWMYFNWERTDNQMMSANTSTDLLDDVVLYQIGSEDNIAEAGNISLSYNGQTITVVSDK